LRIAVEIGDRLTVDQRHAAARIRHDRDFAGALVDDPREERTSLASDVALRRSIAQRPNARCFARASR
jgi:hypothetical protein